MPKENAELAETESTELEGNELESQEETEQLEDQPPEISEDETRASGNGWTDREAWEGKGGDPDEWVSARKFNERGEMIGNIRSLKQRLDDQEKKFDARLDHNKTLHEAQMKVTIADLEAKRDDAIDLADRDKANQIQGQIDEVKATSVDVAPETVTNDQSALDDWNDANSWVTDEDSPKAAYAIQRFNRHLVAGKTNAQAIASMELEVAKQFPDKNERRENVATVEGGRSKPGKRAVVKLSWDQVTPEEMKWYKAISWKSKDDFLQAVSDERKAQ